MQTMCRKVCLAKDVFTRVGETWLSKTRLLLLLITVMFLVGLSSSSSSIIVVLFNSVEARDKLAKLVADVTQIIDV
jgi:hypothetical protein